MSKIEIIKLLKNSRRKDSRGIRTTTRLKAGNCTDGWKKPGECPDWVDDGLLTTNIITNARTGQFKLKDRLGNVYGHCSVA